MTLKEILEERANIFEKIKDIDSRADEDGNLSAEDQEQFENLSTRYDELTEEKEQAEKRQAKRKKRQDKMAKMKQDMNKRGGPQVALDIDDEPSDDVPVHLRDNPRATDEYRESYWRTMRRGRYQSPDPDDVRALKIADDEKGGYLAPAQFEQEIIVKFREENIVRDYANVITSSSDRRIPVERDRSNFEYIPEEGKYPETEVKFGMAAMGAYKIGGIIKCSEELMQDAYFDLEGYLRDEMGEAGGEAEEEKFIEGSGNNEPEGLLVGSEQGKETDANDDVEADELFDLYHSVHRRYRDRGYWMFNDSTALVLRKKKDGDGNYLWQGALQAGEPDRILGRPVLISEFMPDMGSGNKFMLFGALRYYRIMDRIGLSIQRLDEKYADTGQIGFRGHLRNDGQLLRPDAVKHMKNA